MKPAQMDEPLPKCPWAHRGPTCPHSGTQTSCTLTHTGFQSGHIYTHTHTNMHSWAFYTHAHQGHMATHMGGSCMYTHAQGLLHTFATHRPPTGSHTGYARTNTHGISAFIHAHMDPTHTCIGLTHTHIHTAPHSSGSPTGPSGFIWCCPQWQSRLQLLVVLTVR